MSDPTADCFAAAPPDPSVPPEGAAPPDPASPGVLGISDPTGTFALGVQPTRSFRGTVAGGGRASGNEAARCPPACRSRIVIPARLGSTRLPEKLLLAETGKPLIQHTYEAAQRARRPGGVCVATDHRRIFDAVRAFGGHAEMTDPAVPSGTDRVAEVARRMTGVEIVVNLQGDEPELPGASIDLAVQLLEDEPEAVMATLATPIRRREQLDDPACVKVVFDRRGRAMYFSRSPIPCARDGAERLFGATPPVFFQHIGLYAYRREFLLKLAEMPPSALERAEKLEQLRVLEAGYPILVGVVGEASAGIDTPEDYRAFVERWRGRQ